MRREFEGIRQQVFEDLLQPLRIAREASRQAVVDDDLEGQILGLGEMAEVAVDAVAEGAECDLLGFNGDRARFDLGQVQDVVDQREQVRSG